MSIGNNFRKSREFSLGVYQIVYSALAEDINMKKIESKIYILISCVKFEWWKIKNINIEKYIVQTGKTLRLYCDRFGMNFDALVNLNFIREINLHPPLSSWIN